MYKYKDIAFRPIDKLDLNVITELKNDESTFLNLGTVDMYNSVQQEEWLANVSKNSQRNKNFVIITIDNEMIIGVIRIYDIDTINSNCEVGIDIVKEYRGKGYGSKAYQMILKYIFEHLNMHMVYLKVMENNETALLMYKKVGFTITGYYREYMYRYGKYWNYNIMCITRSEFYKDLKWKR